MKYQLIGAALVVVAQAAQAQPFPQPQSIITSTTPHYLRKTITIDPGKKTAAIKIPATNVPVHMMVAVPTFGDRGIAEVTIMSVGSNDAFLAWMGFDGASNMLNGTATVSSNDGPAPNGTHIVYADAAREINVEQASADQIVIKSTQTKIMTVVVTFSW